MDAIHAAFHRPSSRVHKRVDTAVWTLVLASIALLIVEPFVPVRFQRVLVTVDRVILGLFAVELVLRVVSYRPPALEVFAKPPLGALRTHLTARFRYLLRPMTLIDLITVLAVVPQLRGIRVLRFLRLLRSSRLFRYANPFEGLTRAFENDRLLFAFAFSVLAVETILGGLSLYLLERGHADGVESVGEGMYWALVTLTTVGYGDVTPATDLGRVVAGALMIGGMFTLALFAGIVGRSLLNAVLSIRGEQFRMGNYVNHVVVCGYEEGAELLLRELREELDLDQTRIVLFSRGERPAGVPPEFLWVAGDPTKESELDKVRLTHASSILIIAPRSLRPEQADAATLLTIFTARAYLAKRAKDAKRKRPVHVVAEILDSENIQHAEAAGADEVIESRRLGFSILAHTLAFPGVGHLTSEVVASGSMNIYVGLIPEGVEAKTFGELADLVRAKSGALAIGLLGKGGEKINPPDDTAVPDGSHVVYLAAKPVLESP
ncbi:MAG: ion transporter [Myxococcota bacterium]